MRSASLQTPAQADSPSGRLTAAEQHDSAAGLFRNLVEHSLVGIQILQDGRYAYANQKLAELFGYTIDELLALDSWKEVVAVEDLDMVVDQVRRRLSGEAPHAHYVFRGLRKDGTVIDIEIRSDRAELHGRPAVIGMLIDISERRRAEQALRESEARFRNAFDLTNVAMVLTDLDHRFVRVNDAFAQMFGYSKAEMLKLSMGEITLPDDLAESYRRREPLLAGTADYFQMEKRYLHKDGHVIWALTNVSIIRDASGKPHQYVGQVQDITERKHAETALRESERRFRALIENSNDAITLNTADGGIVYASPSTHRVLGYSADELIGTSSVELIHPEDHHKLRSSIGPILGRLGAVATDEYRVRQKDGAWRWIEATCTNLLSDPSIGALVCNLRDITGRKRLEDQYRHAQKMEAVGRLAGGVAHDFNNLLTIILGYSEIILQGVSTDDPMRELIEQIEKAGERAALLTRQLLAFSRKQVLQPSLLNLNQLVADMGKMLVRLIGEDVDLAVIAASDLWPVRADAGQVQQVLLNLAVNARDAMPQGGKLTIETANVELDDLYVNGHPEAHAGEYVRLAVTDSGCGIDAATLRQIFEPFFTTKGDKGTGLGLATVYGIVKQSGGHIEVYSEVGTGTTFKIYLRRDRSKSSHTELRRSRTQLPSGSETILLAEDEDALRTLTRLVLERRGYKVLEARHGEEVLQLCEQCQDAIDLLVTDVVMPNMSGRQVAERLSSLRPELKVLYLSGYTDDSIVRHGMLEAGVHFLQKPFTADILTQTVRAVLDAQ